MSDLLDKCAADARLSLLDRCAIEVALTIHQGKSKHDIVLAVARAILTAPVSEGMLDAAAEWDRDAPPRQYENVYQGMAAALLAELTGDAGQTEPPTP